MLDPNRDRRPPADAVQLCELLRTATLGEAMVVRQLLRAYGLLCYVHTPFSHTVLPLYAGYGGVRVFVPVEDVARSHNLLAEHRRNGLRILSGGRG